jgi:hypothetical protein
MHNFNLQFQGFVPREFIAKLHRDCFMTTRSSECYAGFEGVESLDQWVEGTTGDMTMPMPDAPAKMRVRLGSSHSQMATDSATGEIKDSNMDHPYVEFYFKEDFVASPISPSIGIQVELSVRYDLRSGAMMVNAPKFHPVLDVAGATGPEDIFPAEADKYDQEPDVSQVDTCQTQFDLNRAAKMMEGASGTTNADAAFNNLAADDERELCPTMCQYALFENEWPTCTIPAQESTLHGENEHYPEPPYVPESQKRGAVCTFDGLYHESCGTCPPHLPGRKREPLHIGTSSEESGQKVCLVPSPETCGSSTSSFFCTELDACVSHCDDCRPGHWGDSLNHVCVVASVAACEAASTSKVDAMHFCAPSQSCVSAKLCHSCTDKMDETDFRHRVPGIFGTSDHHKCVAPSPQTCKGIDEWGNRIGVEYMGVAETSTPQAFCPVKSDCVRSCHECEGFKFKPTASGHCSDKYMRGAECNGLSTPKAFCASTDECVDAACSACMTHDGSAASSKGTAHFCMVPAADCLARGKIYCEEANKCSEDECRDCHDETPTENYDATATFNNTNAYYNTMLAGVFAVDTTANKCVAATATACQGWDTAKIFCPASESCLNLDTVAGGQTNVCARDCHHIDFEGGHKLSEFISTVSPADGCLTKAGAIAHCQSLSQSYCEATDQCVDDCTVAGACETVVGRDATRKWGVAGTNQCDMADGHTCAPGEVYCDIDNKCHYGCHACVSSNGSVKKTARDVAGDRTCVVPNAQTCAAEGRLYCALTSACTDACEMCVQGGDGTFLELDTTAGATAFAVNLIAYKYAIQTKDSSGNIDGRKCGPYTDKIAECNALPGHTGSKWCEIDSSDGYCVTNCDQCEFSVVIEETSQGAEENDATTVAQAFNAGFKAGRTSVGTFTVQFHEEDSSDGLCRTSGRQCRKMFQGGQHYAYCASTNQCVSECEQCPGRNYKDSHFDECTAAPTEYGQGN